MQAGVCLIGVARLSEGFVRHALFSLVLYCYPALPGCPRRSDNSPQARLWDAAIAGGASAMAGALREGAAIDSLDTRRNPNGRRALNWAAWYNQVPASRLLLARGAPLEARNRTGFTALHHAAETAR